MPMPQTIPEAPAPQNVPEPPPQPTPDGAPPFAAEDPAAADAGAGYPAPSADAADVEIEEVPTDGSAPAPRAATTAGENLQPMAAGGTGARAQGAGGSGAPLPPGGGAAAPAYRGAAPPEGGGSHMGAAGTPPPTPGMTAPGMQVGAETTAEQVAALDRQLNARLAEFDTRMRAAQAAAAEERAALAAGGATSGRLDGRGSRLEMPPEGRGAAGGAASGSGLGVSPDLVGETSGGALQAAAAVPADLPDGRDDDIVARQLREAASKEPDPVLREKLWAEYRKYKAGL